MKINLKNIFAKKLNKKHHPATEHKALSRETLYALQRSSFTGWSGRDYTSLSNNGFAQNVIAYRCIRLISEAAAMIPVLCHVDGKEVKDHPLLNVVHNPNTDQSLPDFLERVYGFLLVSGNVYIERACDEGVAKSLYLLRPDRVRVKVDDYGWPKAYEYRLDGRDPRVLAVNHVSPVLHHRLFHPANDHYGMSPLSVAGKSIDIHNGSSQWNKALLDNLARPSGALTYKGPEGAPNLTDEQFSRLKAELEENYQGSENAGRPLLLEGGLSWLALSLSPQDMDFIDSKNLAAREIALAFGVPPQLLGIPGDNTYANYAEANRALWRQTVLPMVHRFLTAFSIWLSQGLVSTSASASATASASAFVISADLNAVPALAEERSRLWQRIGEADFLTINEKRAALGYGVIDGGDYFQSRKTRKQKNAD